MYVMRKYSEELLGGHLVEHTSYGVEYPVVAKSSRAGLLIKDDQGKDVWLSNSVIIRHFHIFN